jgi:hypothetical protein
VPQITGNLRDALGQPTLIGDLTLTPAATSDARTSGSDAYLGSIRYSLESLPSPLTVPSGAWRLSVKAQGKVNGTDQFKTLSTSLVIDQDYTWAQIVNGLVTDVPITPTLLQQAADYAAAADADRQATEAARDEAEAFGGTNNDIIDARLSQLDVTGKTTAQVNTWLASPSPLGVKRLFGQVTINAPLVVHSDTLLDATGATITLAAGAGTNVLQNAAVTAQRTISAAAMSAASTTIIAAGAAFTSADVGRSVNVAGAGHGGKVLTTRVVSVQSSTQATLAKAATTAAASTTATVYTRDKNITIVGGTWDKANNTGVEVLDLHNFRLRRVDGIRMFDGTWKSTNGKFSISLADVTDVVVERSTFNCSSDGVHVMGPARGVHIEKVFGSTGDDSVAIGTTDYPTYDDTIGDIHDVTVSGVYSTTLKMLVKFFGGDGGVLRSALCEKVYGTAGAWAAVGCVNVDPAGGSAALTHFDVDDLTFRDIHPTLTAAIPFVSLTASAAGTITLDNVSPPPNTPASSHLIGCAHPVGTQYPGPTIERLVLRNCELTTASTVARSILLIGDGNGAAVINNLELQNCSLVVSNAGGASAALVTAQANAVIGDLVVTGGRVRGNGGQWGTGININNSSASVGSARFVGTQFDGCRSVIEMSSGTTLSAEISGFRARQSARLGNISGTLDVTLTGGVADTTSPWFHASGGTITVRGGGTRRVGTQEAFSRSGTEVLRAINHEVMCDVSLLARNLGDRAYNLRVERSCGLGLVTSDGTSWKNVYTGATYT